MEKVLRLAVFSIVPCVVQAQAGISQLDSLLDPKPVEVVGDVEVAVDAKGGVSIFGQRGPSARAGAVAVLGLLQEPLDVQAALEKGEILDAQVFSAQEIGDYRLEISSVSFPHLAIVTLAEGDTEFELLLHAPILPGVPQTGSLAALTGGGQPPLCSQSDLFIAQIGTSGPLTTACTGTNLVHFGCTGKHWVKIGAKVTNGGPLYVPANKTHIQWNWASYYLGVYPGCNALPESHVETMPIETVIPAFGFVMKYRSLYVGPCDAINTCCNPGFKKVWSFGAMADPYNAVKESNEGNNIMPSALMLCDFCSGGGSGGGPSGGGAGGGAVLQTL